METNYGATDGQCKVAIVTGANSGLGEKTAANLYGLGYSVILACRNFTKGEESMRKILSAPRQSNSQSIKVLKLDLSDLSSIREFVIEFKRTYSRLDVLVNNAGLSKGFAEKTPEFTKDGFELTVGTNHLGHFLLTHLLLDLLKSTYAQTGDARVVILTSMLHLPNTSMEKRYHMNPQLDFEDLFLKKADAYSGAQAYKNSKTMDIMFTFKLARILAAEGSGVTVNCICPGFIPETGLFRQLNPCSRCCMVFVFNYMLCCCRITRTAKQGAHHITQLATADNVRGVSGKWYTDGAEKESSEESRDEAKQDALWTWSEEQVGLAQQDRL